MIDKSGACTTPLSTAEPFIVQRKRMKVTSVGRVSMSEKSVMLIIEPLESKKSIGSRLETLKTEFMIVLLADCASW